MGFYWTNFVYYGVIISKEQYEHINGSLISNETELYNSYFHKCGKKYILCIPQTYFNFGNIDPMFEANEIERKFVWINDIRSCLRTRSLTETQINTILNPSKEDRKILDHIINLLNDNNVKARLEMGQVFSSSLSNEDDSAIDYILEVKND